MGFPIPPLSRFASELAVTLGIETLIAVGPRIMWLSDRPRGAFADIDNSEGLAQRSLGKGLAASARESSASRSHLVS